MKDYIKNIKLKYEFVFVCLISFCLWSALGTKIQLTDSNIIKILIKDSFNNLRFFLPFCILIFFLYKKNKNNFGYKYLNLIILSIFFSYLIGYINFYLVNTDYVERFLLDKSLINTGYLPNKLRDLFLCLYFLITFLILSKLNFNQIKFLNICNFCLIILISSITLFFSYYEYLTTNKAFLYYTTYLVDGEIFGVATLRSLGLARNLLIISIPLILFNLFYNNNKNLKYLINFLIIILLTNLFQTQSRLSIFSCYIFISVIFFINFKNKNYKNILTIFFVTLLIPHLISYGIPKIKSIYLNNNINIQSRIFSTNPNNLGDVKVIYKNKKETDIFISNSDSDSDSGKSLIESDMDISIDVYSSGRYYLWKKAIRIFLNENNFKLRYLGFGPLSDRYFLKENVSNAIVYVLFSGGVLGGLSIILLYLITLSHLIKFIFRNKSIKKDLIGNSIIFIILFIFLRSLVENSFVIYGTDHIIFISSLLYLINKNQQIPSKTKHS